MFGLFSFHIHGNGIIAIMLFPISNLLFQPFSATMSPYFMYEIILMLNVCDLKTFSMILARFLLRMRRNDTFRATIIHQTGIKLFGDRQHRF